MCVFVVLLVREASGVRETQPVNTLGTALTLLPSEGVRRTPPCSFYPARHAALPASRNLPGHGDHHYCLDIIKFFVGEPGNAPPPFSQRGPGGCYYTERGDSPLALLKGAERGWRRVWCNPARKVHEVEQGLCAQTLPFDLPTEGLVMRQTRLFPLKGYDYTHTIALRYIRV
ncbi:hypothetical protein E2C01_010366 [Portunus trituberculatus]|uniref:Uncharacterized protein n=1 Tax=Portunus trituberculatus TaxID=210409 RepID=A0A5B7D8F6_PORTR|nr:hypothetical protein [Portunus trituberculatus]